MPTDPTRGLLCAIFAIHLNFITRNQLAAAIAEWIRDPARAIAEILVAQKAIDPRTREIVEDVVARHLEQHHGDVEQSLATLDAKGLIPPELASVLGDSLTSEARPPASAGAEASTPVSLDGYASGGTRYRVLGPQERGGMGEVLVARDLELGRKVLLKQLPDRNADDPGHRASFLKEILAGAALEHPNIAPVYDIGQYPGGRLFQVMRLIPGGTLARAIRDHHASGGAVPVAGRMLRFRELLGHFVDACQAIEYAHSRGVLHRDIKPNNIMLGSFGETQVIDWGLARIAGHDLSAGKGSPEELISPADIGEDSQPTKEGQFKGTPAYASPEQADGKQDLIDARSDVYGLGATLYCLLTGEAPFHVRSPLILDDVKNGRFPRPRLMRADVPPALESICLKAMAKAQKDRYQSPRDLATDVERWLADEPVLAHPDPFSVRLRRWGLRHRTAVAAAAALLLTSVVGLGIGYAAVKEQRDVAEKSTDLTLTAIEDIVIKIGEESWAQEPESLPRRQQAVERAIEMYEDVLQSDSRNSRATQGLNNARQRKGFLERLSGDDSLAIESFKKSIEGLEQQLESSLKNPIDFRDIIATRSDMAMALLFSEGSAAAESFQRQTCERAAAVLKNEPESQLAKEMNACAERALASILEAAGKTEDAVALMVRSADTYSELAADDEGLHQQAFRACTLRAESARCYRRLGRLDEARKAAKMARNLNEGLMAFGVDFVDLRQANALTLRELAMTVDEPARAEADEMLRDSLGIYDQLMKLNRKIWRYQRDFSETYVDRGRMRLQNADVEGAERDVDAILKEWQPTDWPPAARAQTSARLFALRGLIAEQRGDEPRARELLKSALEHCVESRRFGFGVIADVEAEVGQHLERLGSP